MVCKTKDDAVRLMTTFNPSRQCEFGMYPERCIMGKAPTLAVIRRDYGAEISRKWLVIEIGDFNNFVGISEEKKMSLEVMKSLADMIMSRYYYLKLSEVMLFFMRLKYGDYGEMYGSVDAVRILSAMRKFITQRNSIIIQEEQKEYERQMAESKKNAISREKYDRRHKRQKD